MDDAAIRTATPLELLLNANIKILRVGLCETESLHTAGKVLGGAYHPALGELCYCAFYLKRISEQLSSMSLPLSASVMVSVSPGKLSMAIGQKRCNVKAIKDKYPTLSLHFVEDSTLKDYSVRVDLIQEMKGSN